MCKKAFSQYADDDTNDSSGVDEPHAKCSRIHFDKSFHIDVPAYHLDDSRDARALAVAKNGWQDSDPKAIYNWWKTVTGSTDRARCRRLVRYLKMWSALKVQEEARPASILIIVLVAEAFSDLDRDQHSGDDEFLREIVAAIVARLEMSYEVSNPANTDENLNRLDDDASLKMLENFRTLTSIADRALAQTTKTTSAEIWSEAFDQFFPAPSDDDKEEALLKEAAGRALATTTFVPIVAIEATTGHRKFHGIDRIGPIPKGCDIQFSIANAQQLPRDAIVTWMVRNTGREAEQRNHLGHRKGVGLSVSEESAYRGKHYMDVSVNLRGVLIGSKRVPVEVMGIGLPKRNSAKPAWNKMR